MHLRMQRKRQPVLGLTACTKKMARPKGIPKMKGSVAIETWGFAHVDPDSWALLEEGKWMPWGPKESFGNLVPIQRVESDASEEEATPNWQEDPMLMSYGVKALERTFEMRAKAQKVSPQQKFPTEQETIDMYKLAWLVQEEYLPAEHDHDQGEQRPWLDRETGQLPELPQQAGFGTRGEWLRAVHVRLESRSTMKLDSAFVDHAWSDGQKFLKEQWLKIKAAYKAQHGDLKNERWMLNNSPPERFIALWTARSKLLFQHAHDIKHLRAMTFMPERYTRMINGRPVQVPATFAKDRNIKKKGSVQPPCSA